MSATLAIPKNDFFLADYGDRARSPSLTIDVFNPDYLVIYAGAQEKGNKSYFIIGVRFMGPDGEAEVLPIRGMNKGCKLGETSSSFPNGFIVCWAEGDLGDFRQLAKFFPKGKFHDAEDYHW